MIDPFHLDATCDLTSILITLRAMVLYDERHKTPLTDYGLLVPIPPDRVGPILDVLYNDPVLGPRRSDWLTGPDGRTISRQDLLLVNTDRYVSQLYDGDVEAAVLAAFELVDAEGNFHRYDPAIASAPLRGLFDRALTMVEGTWQAGREALKNGFCFHCGGGAHHGHPDFGHGFCILNDAAIAVRKLQADGCVRTALIIDIDVHKGDGTAAIFERDETVTTVSIHMAHGWPLDIPERDDSGNRHPSHTPSDIDVPIAEGEEADYLPRLRSAFEALSAAASLSGPPDIAYVLAGADPYEKDGLESSQLMNLTLEQMNERNLMTYSFLSRLGIPQAWLMAGGYGEHAWETYPDILMQVLSERLS